MSGGAYAALATFYHTFPPDAGSCPAANGFAACHASQSSSQGGG